MPIPETHRAMEQLHENGMQVGLLTNIYPGVYQVAMERGVIPELPYHSVIQSCIVGAVKSNMRMFEIAQEMASVHPAEIIFVDDRSENTEAARSLGWNAYLFKQS